MHCFRGGYDYSTIFQYVFTKDFVAPELEEIAAPDFDVRARRGRTGNRPLGDAAIAVRPMVVVAVVRVGESREPVGDAFTDRVPADKSPPAGFRAARHIEDAIVREESHDGVHVVSIERGEELAHRCNPTGLLVRHLSLLTSN